MLIIATKTSPLQDSFRMYLSKAYFLLTRKFHYPWRVVVSLPRFLLPLNLKLFCFHFLCGYQEKISRQKIWRNLQKATYCCCCVVSFLCLDFRGFSWIFCLVFYYPSLSRLIQHKRNIFCVSQRVESWFRNSYKGDRQMRFQTNLSESDIKKWVLKTHILNWEVVVAQLAERSLMIPVDPGSNPIIGNFYWTFIYC